jgi:hypothetical protein
MSALLQLHPCTQASYQRWARLKSAVSAYVLLALIVLWVVGPSAAFLACDPGTVTSYAFVSTLDKSLVEVPRAVGSGSAVHAEVTITDVLGSSLRAGDPGSAGTSLCVRILEIGVRGAASPTAQVVEALPAVAVVQSLSGNDPVQPNRWLYSGVSSCRVPPPPHPCVCAHAQASSWRPWSTFLPAVT